MLYLQHQITIKTMKPNLKRTLEDYKNQPFTIVDNFLIMSNKKGLVLVGRKYKNFKGIPSVLKSRKFLIDEVKIQLNLSKVEYIEVKNIVQRTKHYKTYSVISDSFEVKEYEITTRIYSAKQLANLVNKYLIFWNTPIELHLTELTISIKNWNKIILKEIEK